MRYWKVYSKIDRGEGSAPRYVGGYCHWDGKTRDKAEQIAAQQRAQGHLEVKIVECTRFGDPT